MLRLTTVLVTIALFGCATSSPPPIHALPPGYTGPRVELWDFGRAVGSSQVELYFVEDVDGLIVHNALSETIQRSAGRGFSVTPQYVTRDVVAGRPIRITLRARTHYAAPILTLAKTVHEVKGTVEVTLKPGARYVVMGRLSDEDASVWIEDGDTKAVVAKVDQTGKSRLGTLQK